VPDKQAAVGQTHLEVGGETFRRPPDARTRTSEVLDRCDARLE
jgi:hypothetical protein